jgi:hypothetical protein
MERAQGNEKIRSTKGIKDNIKTFFFIGCNELAALPCCKETPLQQSSLKLIPLMQTQVFYLVASRLNCLFSMKLKIRRGVPNGDCR